MSCCSSCSAGVRPAAASWHERCRHAHCSFRYQWAAVTAGLRGGSGLQIRQQVWNSCFAGGTVPDMVYSLQCWHCIATPSPGLAQGTQSKRTRLALLGEPDPPDGDMGDLSSPESPYNSALHSAAGHMSGHLLKAFSRLFCSLSASARVWGSFEVTSGCPSSQLVTTQGCKGVPMISANHSARPGAQDGSTLTASSSGMTNTTAGARHQPGTCQEGGRGSSEG